MASRPPQFNVFRDFMFCKAQELVLFKLKVQLHYSLTEEFINDSSFTELSKHFKVNRNDKMIEVIETGKRLKYGCHTAEKPKTI